MMRLLLAALPYALQLLCIIHIFKTGKNTFWVYVIIFVPYLGGVAYLIAEILPSLKPRGGLVEAADIVVSKIAPTHRIRSLEQKAEFSPNFANKRLLANECLACGYFERAADIYASILTGINKDNQDIALLRAKALYGAKRYDEAAEIVTRLDAEGFEYKKESEVLIRLKVLEHSLPAEKVHMLYREAKGRFNSFEIYYYYIEFMIARGNLKEAGAALEEITEVKRQLDRNGIIYAKDWARKALSLRFRMGPK